MSNTSGTTRLPSPPVTATLEQHIPEYLLAPVRRWRVTVFCFVLSTLVAIGLATRYAQKTWQLESAVIYTPLPLGTLSNADYAAANPQTLMSLIRSPQRLEQIVADMQLPVSARVLERSLKVNQQANVDAVRLTLDWSDPDAAQAILNRIIETYIRETVELRRVKLQETLGLLQAEHAMHQRQLEEAKAAYARLPGDSTRGRLQTELTRHAAAETALNTELSQTTERLLATQRRLTKVRGKAQSRESLTDEDYGPLLERKHLLVDGLRGHPERLKELDAEIATKKADLETQNQAMAAGVGSKIDHLRISGELDLLLARRRSAVSIAAEQQKELTELPLRQAQVVLANLEEERAQLEGKVASLKRDLTASRDEAIRLGELSATEQLAAKRVEQSEAGLQTTANRIAGMERLRDSSLAEFAIAQPPAIVGPPTSNRKVLTLLVFGVLMSLSLAGIIGHAWYTQPRSSRRIRAGGLPILALSETSASPRATETRRLALQLRDPVKQSGGLVLVVSADQATASEDLAWHLARYLALGDEKILVLDTRPADVSTGATAVNWALETKEVRALSAATDPDHSSLANAANLIRKTSHQGVDYLPLGTVSPDPDELASAAMQRLLVKFAEQYDRVLLLSPALGMSLSPEILAGYADGAIVVFRNAVEVSSESEQAIEAIRTAGTPWVGAVVRSDRHDEGEELPFAREVLSTVGERGTRNTPAGTKRLPDEEPGVLSIAWAQSPGLGGDSPGPFEAETLHPARRSADAAD